MLKARLTANKTFNLSVQIDIRDLAAAVLFCQRQQIPLTGKATAVSAVFNAAVDVLIDTKQSIRPECIEDALDMLQKAFPTSGNLIGRRSYKRVAKALRTSNNALEQKGDDYHYDSRPAAEMDNKQKELDILKALKEVE